MLVQEGHGVCAGHRIMCEWSFMGFKDCMCRKRTVAKFTVC